MDENLLKEKVILVVDDENDLRDIVASEFDFMGAKVFQAENVAAARDILQKNKIDLVVSDIRMPGGTGVDLMDGMKERDPDHPPIILITGFADITVEKAFDKGSEALLNKPFQLDELIQTAVRFTTPLPARFQEVRESHSAILTQTFEKSLNESLGDGLRLGRGGFSLDVATRGRKFELGEIIPFELKFTDRVLKGQAACRWYRHSESKTGHAFVGLEIVHLDGEDLTFFLEYWKKNPTLPFIPAYT